MCRSLLMNFKTNVVLSARRKVYLHNLKGAGFNSGEPKKGMTFLIVCFFLFLINIILFQLSKVDFTKGQKFCSSC
jgi:hypothetical protein